MLRTAAMTAVRRTSICSTLLAPALLSLSLNSQRVVEVHGLLILINPIWQILEMSHISSSSRASSSYPRQSSRRLSRPRMARMNSLYPRAMHSQSVTSSHNLGRVVFRSSFRPETAVLDLHVKATTARTQPNSSLNFLLHALLSPPSDRRAI